jgi:hypothetical protein
VYERPALTKHQKAVAAAVAASLEPILIEMGRRLDSIAEKHEALMAQLDAASTALDKASRLLAVMACISMTFATRATNSRPRARPVSRT